MDKHRRDLRRAAAQAFLESLDQLQDTLTPAPHPLPPPPAPKPEPPPAVLKPPRELSIPLETARIDRPHEPLRSCEFDLTELEQAAADIEQFIQSRHFEPEVDE